MATLGPGMFNKARERVKKGVALGRAKLEGGQSEGMPPQEAAALDEAVALGLAAFAVQASRYLSSKCACLA